MKGTIRYYFILLIILIFSSSRISLSSIINELPDDKRSIFQPVINKLLSYGMDSNFIYQALSSPEVQFNERFVRINVTNFVNNPDYSNNWSIKSIEQGLNYLNKNIEILKLAELEYGIPKEIITSILFIETKHGNFLGNNNVMSVYFSTALCNEPIYIEKNIEYLKSKNDLENFNDLKNKIIERSKRKSNWAYEQIKALYKMSKIAPFSVFDLKGSWAGAFGISQFLPTSYLNWAVDGNKDLQINLFDNVDAIFSVANYLKSNGWGNTLEEQKKAIFHYNNSSAYVEAVLRLADSLKVNQYSNYNN